MVSAVHIVLICHLCIGVSWKNEMGAEKCMTRTGHGISRCIIVFFFLLRMICLFTGIVVVST